jgi:hypothetical protein
MDAEVEEERLEELEESGSGKQIVVAGVGDSDWETPVRGIRIGQSTFGSSA